MKSILTLVLCLLCNLAFAWDYASLNDIKYKDITVILDNNDTISGTLKEVKQFTENPKDTQSTKKIDHNKITIIVDKTTNNLANKYYLYILTNSNNEYSEYRIDSDSIKSIAIKR